MFQVNCSITCLTSTSGPCKTFLKMGSETQPIWFCADDSAVSQVSSIAEVSNGYVKKSSSNIYFFSLKCSPLLLYVKVGVTFSPRGAEPARVRRLCAIVEDQRRALNALAQTVLLDIVFFTNHALGAKQGPSNA